MNPFERPSEQSVVSEESNAPQVKQHQGEEEQREAAALKKKFGIFPKQTFQERIQKVFRSNPRLVIQVILIFIGSLGFITTVFLCKSPDDAVVITLPINSSGAIDPVKAREAADNNRRAIEQEHTKNLLRGAFSSFILVGLIDLMALGLQKVTKRGERKKFEEFFGVDVSNKKGMIAIFFTAIPPDFSVIEKIIPEEIKENLKWIECPHALDAKANNAQPKGIQSVVPFAELKAVLDIQKLFSDFGLGENFEIEQDKGISEGFPVDRTVLAIGLGFNSATKKINNYCGDLFNITYPLDTKTKLKSDDFNIRKYTGKYGLKDHETPSDDYDYALFSRVLYKGRVYLVCAGRTAIGTEAACKYLANNWLILMDKYYHNFDDKIYNTAVCATIWHNRESRQLG
jgi:hypothetical protein